ncbi:MAG: chitobiase/beta-hexosaminidase C-terminal domain-containing protein [Clostridia bacterium]|nr:chitobiase/beta-hexosaminidase C-terminal domain-containing protein [Clostridia bacterium]
MICKRCGNSLPDGAVVCDQCGYEIGASRSWEGSAGRRQGKEDRPSAGRTGSAMETVDSPFAEPTGPVMRRPGSEGAGKPNVRKGVLQPAAAANGKTGRTRQDLAKPVHRMMVNWALVFTVLLVLAIFAVIGGYVFLKVTDSGQLILARLGRDADATALWTYGQELLDQGHVGRAIETYEKALEQEPEREDLYARLTQLADAYEAAGRTADAERVYTKMYTEVDKENTYAYTEMMRILENQDRRLELSSFLKLAYENTKDAYFRRQREELLPSTPTASEEAGARKYEQDVRLISAEDYDIYYLFGDEGILPEDGTLYTAPIHLGEGSFIIRAVAVSSDLISDEMRIQYTISLPTPLAPGISLAPGTYEKRQRIWLKHIESEDEMILRQKQNKSPEEMAILAKLTNITIYYTVDGQTPTSNSPIFDGEPFYLPAGSSTLKAVAVNGYGKVSNILERTYKINVPFKKYFNESDEFPDVSLMKTTREAFVKKFGNPASQTDTEDDTVEGNTIQLHYSWGSAKFTMADSGYLLYAYETTNSSVAGPRKTRIGMTEKDITELFRDMGQASDQNGDRSIYYDKAVGYAKKYHLDETHDRIDYAYLRQDNGMAILSYYLENGKVVRMGMKCVY